MISISKRQKIEQTIFEASLRKNVIVQTMLKLSKDDEVKISPLKSFLLRE